MSTDVPPSSRMEACGHQHPAEPARTPKSLLNMSVQGLVTSRTTHRHLSGGNRTCKGPTLWKMLVRRAGESLGYAGERGRGGGDRRPTRPRTKTTQGCLAAAWDHGVTCLTHKLRYDFRQNVCFSRSVRENEKTEHGKTKRNEMLSLQTSRARGSEPRSEASAHRPLSFWWLRRRSPPRPTAPRRRGPDADTRPNCFRGRGRARGTCRKRRPRRQSYLRFNRREN